jgi:APA family basic amino acid/polyamine antiporter
VFFARLASVHPTFGTPAAAIVGTALWSIVLVLSGSFEQLLTYVVFMSWVWFALAAAAIFVYRRRTTINAERAEHSGRAELGPTINAEPAEHAEPSASVVSAVSAVNRDTGFRTPGYPATPALFILAALVIVLNTVVAQPVQSGIGLALACLGIPAYSIWRRTT